MKKFVSVALVAIMVFSACIPSFAQRGVGIKPVTKVGPVQFESIEAFSEGRGAIVRWKTSSETGNVGFNIYRTNRRGSQLVNPAMVLGSYAKIGEKTSYGDDYQIFDPNGRPGASYRIQSFLLDGSRIFSETFTAKLVDDLDEATGNLAVGSAQALKEAAFSANRDVVTKTPELSPELLDAVESSVSTPDLTTQRLIASKPGAKIAVKKEGLYRIPRSQLPASVFDGTSSANWRLFMQGNEQSIIVGAGDQYIEFYGKGLDTVESDTRMYYLIADTVPGKRMAAKVLRSFSGNAPSTRYSMSSEKKERVSYTSKIQNGDAENYWGRVITMDPLAQIGPVDFKITGIDFQTVNAQITLKMMGFSPTVHDTRFVINGFDLGTITGGFGPGTAFSGSFTVPTAYLVEGANSIVLYTSNSGDYSLFDSISIKYNRKYAADQNTLVVPSPQSRKFDITGFASANVRVFDTTADSDPQQVIGLPVVQNGSTYTVKFPANRQFLYYAVEDSAILQLPASSVTANNPSTLSTVSNGANLVIISYSAPDFMAAAETWANYRRGQGFTVKVIDVADIYDEFNYGTPSADSLKSFFNYAYNSWQTPPQYALLLGDGSYDPRNYNGFGDWNFIPGKYVPGIYEEVVSDEALADFNGDGLAEIAIGRIPARIGADITIVYNRTVAFETPAMQSLNRGVGFAYDEASDYNFQGFSQDLRNELPLNIPTPFVNRVTPGAQTTLINEINNGRFLINYSGHGAAGIWAASSFFGVNNVQQLTNTNNPTVFTMLTCLNGYFMRPDADSLSEKLLFSGRGGAVATWASTTETTPDFQNTMAQRFYNRLNAGNIKRLGDLIKDAKTTVAGSDVAFSWALLGDPMLRMRP